VVEQMIMDRIRGFWGGRIDRNRAATSEFCPRIELSMRDSLSVSYTIELLL
jgi:hypothetical protein